MTHTNTHMRVTQRTKDLDWLIVVLVALILVVVFTQAMTYMHAATHLVSQEMGAQ